MHRTNSKIESYSTRNKILVIEETQVRTITFSLIKINPPKPSPSKSLYSFHSIIPFFQSPSLPSPLNSQTKPKSLINISTSWSFEPPKLVILSPKRTLWKTRLKQYVAWLSQISFIALTSNFKRVNMLCFLLCHEIKLPPTGNNSY